VRDWYEAEVPTRTVMVSELQRMMRRFRVRPLPVIALAALLTAGIAYKVITKPKLYTADVVLAVNEGSMSGSLDKSIPFDQLKEYVASVLLPDDQLTALIERILPGRIATVGAPFALESFRDKVTVSIWKNSFVYFHDVDANAQKSARVGIEVIDEDNERAYEIALAVAKIVIDSHDEQRRKISRRLSDEITLMRDKTHEKIDDLNAAISVKQTAYVEAKKRGNEALAAALSVDLTALAKEIGAAEAQLKLIVSSPDAAANRITAARLDTTISIVDQVKPEKIEQSGMVLAMILAVVAVGSLIGSLLVLGAFDSRVHEVDDITRLGLPVLGHLPGFPGDHVGSLEARGARRRRVPLFFRWRSQR
jgi:hypothetical protein